uniref:Uncharacterized protein n=1 Tax=Arundo donax TaxID=35708 RepID=A0A0A9QBS4_ARUDO
MLPYQGNTSVNFLKGQFSGFDYEFECAYSLRWIRQLFLLWGCI